MLHSPDASIICFCCSLVWNCVDRWSHVCNESSSRFLDNSHTQSICVHNTTQVGEKRKMSFGFLLELGWKIHSIGWSLRRLAYVHTHSPFLAQMRKNRMTSMCCVIHHVRRDLEPNATTHTTPASSMSSAYEKPKMFNSLKWITTDWARHRNAIRKKRCDEEEESRIMERNFSMSYACLAVTAPAILPLPLPLSIQPTKTIFLRVRTILRAGFVCVCVRAKPICVASHSHTLAQARISIS